jgi:hypothetical protein
MQDAAWCVLACKDGSYHYEKEKGTPKDLPELLEYYAKIKKDNKIPKAKSYDNSTSQYGLLGAWSAAEAEVEIPTLYWFLIAKHWSETQLRNGQWEYEPGRGATVNMTAAGLASLLVSHEYIEPALMQGAVGREPYNAPIKKALAWFEQGNNAISVGIDDSFSGGYGTYGIERVGLASGFKFFGTHDWYRAYARRVIDAQAKSKDGSWGGGNVVNTSYFLLFLSRGRHPILMNKLRFDGDAKNPGYWSNRPRDAANLATAMGKKIERQLNWQVINVKTPWQEWLDSPILSVASHQPYKFAAPELDAIRKFVEAGGVLYTQAGRRGPEVRPVRPPAVQGPVQPGAGPGPGRPPAVHERVGVQDPAAGPAEDGRQRGPGADGPLEHRPGQELAGPGPEPQVPPALRAGREPVLLRVGQARVPQPARVAVRPGAGRGQGQAAGHLRRRPAELRRERGPDRLGPGARGVAAVPGRPVAADRVQAGPGRGEDRSAPAGRPGQEAGRPVGRPVRPPDRGSASSSGPRPRWRPSRRSSSPAGCCSST